MEPKIFSTAERAEQIAKGGIVTTFEHLETSPVVEVQPEVTVEVQPEVTVELTPEP